jgi:SNF2 family DNA or RNA helicase
MGLGKTAQAIAFIASSLHHSDLAGKRKPFLIVAPLSTVSNWERELKMWAPQLNVVTLIGNAEAREVISSTISPSLVPLLTASLVSLILYRSF